MMSEDMAVSFTKLRTMSGFTNEELQGISRLQLGTSKTTDEITGQFLWPRLKYQQYKMVYYLMNKNY